MHIILILVLMIFFHGSTLAQSRAMSSMQSRIGIIAGYHDVAYKDSKITSILSNTNLNGIEYGKNQKYYNYGFEYRFNELESVNNNANYNYKYNELNYKLGLIFSTSELTSIVITPQIILGLRKSEFSFIDNAEQRASEKIEEESSMPFNQTVYGLGLPFQISLGRNLYVIFEYRKYFNDPLKIEYRAEEAEVSNGTQYNFTIGFK